MTKVFSIRERRPGLRGALRGLVMPTYRRHDALRGIDLTVREGELVGYIGVNGAGKSTSIKIMCGVIAPTSGEVEVLGRNPFDERRENARHIGVIFGHRSSLWWDLPVMDSLQLVCKMYEVEEPAAARIARYGELLDVGDLLHLPVRNLSLGQRMRAELLAVFIHEPRIVFLDEPTIGLDILMKELIRTFIREINARLDTTVVLTTHDLSDIEAVCDRVVIIEAGRIIYDGSLHAIRRAFGSRRILRFTLERPAGDIDVPAGAVVVSNEDLVLTVELSSEAMSASALATRVFAQADVADFSLQEPSLADIVKSLLAGDPVAG